MGNGYSTAESSFSPSAGFPPARAGDGPPLPAPAHLQNTPRLYPEIQLAQFLPEVKTDRRGHSKNVCYDFRRVKIEKAEQRLASRARPENRKRNRSPQEGHCATRAGYAQPQNGGVTVKHSKSRFFMRIASCVTTVGEGSPKPSPAPFHAGGGVNG